jgi:uncharacterized membrane protein YagU involved in acid resistance
MSFLPPNYSSVSICDPPEYSDIVSNLPSSSPPPYVNSTDSSTVNLPSHLESSPTPEEVYEDSQCVKSCWTFSWILFLIILGLLHLVLSGIYFQCPIPETDLNGIRTLLFVHIIFSVVMIIYCVCKCKCKSMLETNIGLLVTICFYLPFALGLVGFFPLIVRDLNEISEAIQNPLNVTNTYPCSLSFYRLVFGLVIFNYVLAPQLLLFFCLCIVLSSYGGQFFNSINRQVRLELTY